MTTKLCLTVLYVFHILYYTLAYIQHNRDVSLENPLQGWAFDQQFYVRGLDVSVMW